MLRQFVSILWEAIAVNVKRDIGPQAIPWSAMVSNIGRYTI